MADDATAAANTAADAAKDTANTAADAAKSTAQTAADGAQRTFAAGQEAWKEGVDKAASTSNAAFKDAADRSLSALNELNAQGKRNLEAMIASVTAATRGAEALGAQAMGYAKTSVETQVDAARQMSSARSMQELVELQTGFAKKAVESYISEMNKASEIVTAAVKDAMKPLSERAAALSESVQSQR